jgi:hypothetical protein
VQVAFDDEQPAVDVDLADRTAALRRRELARVASDGVQLHRFTAALLRARSGTRDGDLDQDGHCRVAAVRLLPGRHRPRTGPRLGYR